MNNEEKILQMLGGIQSDIAGLKTDVADLKTDVADLKTDVAGLKTDVADLKTDVAGLKTDVAGLKTDVAELKDRTTKIEISLEQQVMPGIQLLAEGHESILEQTASKADVEAVKEEVDTFKLALKAAARA